VNPLSNYQTQREEVTDDAQSGKVHVWKEVEGGEGRTLSLAHWMVCSMTAGKDFRVQNGISSSGGSLWQARERADNSVNTRTDQTLNMPTQ